MMHRVRRYILNQVDQGRLSKDEAFELLREATEPAEAVSPSSQVREVAVPQTQAHVPIAVVGVSCRLPGASSPEEFWHNLETGVDSVGRFPKARLYDVIRTRRSLWEQYQAQVEKAAIPQGGWLEEIDKFDPGFFGISRAEARTLGPSERLFLQVAWEALESAGYSKRTLEGSRTGVYLAHSPEVPFEYARLLPTDDPQAVPFNNPGSTGYQLSYWLNLRGPNLVVNTTCSSSLVAIHTASQALRAGECELAVAGGLSLYIFPFFHDISDPMKLLAADGRCKAFDSSADGLSMGEGVGMAILKRLDRALADGDPILAVVRGSAANSDGRSNGVTSPNPAAQTDVILSAWSAAGVTGDSISYVECHGAGTKLGDPIEVKGLTDAYRRFSSEKRVCALGSAKTNISHLADAAGIAGFMKLVLSLKHRRLPPLLHFRSESPLIPFKDSPFYINTEARPWEPRGGVRRGGVSSFGISGTNCHVVVEEFVPPAATTLAPVDEPRPFLLSARSLGAMWRALERCEKSLSRDEAEGTSLDALCLASLRRELHEYRAVFLCTSVTELRRKISRLGQLRHLERLPSTPAFQGIYVSRVAPGVLEVYSQRPGNELPALPRERTLCLLTEAQPAFLREVDALRAPRAVLPPYCFEKERCWPSHEVPEEAKSDDFFYGLRWVPAERAERHRQALRPGLWLVLDRDDAVGQAVAQRLTEAGARVLRVRPGPRFSRPQPDRVQLDPASSSHFSQLAALIADEKLGPIAGVVHLWSCRSADESMDSFSGVTESQDEAALSAFRLVRALAQRGFGQDADFAVLTAYAVPVDGREARILPVRVTTSGFVKVLSQELPLVGSLSIDFDVDHLPPERIAEHLLAELSLPRPERSEVLAFRGDTRFAQQLDLMPPLPRTPHKLREGGVYVIAGGTGYLGIQLSRVFARKARVKLVLLSRTPLPPRETWAERLKTEPQDSTLRYQISGIMEAESLGSEVFQLCADVTDPVQVEATFDTIRQRWGRIHGVISGMKQLYHKPILSIPEEEFQTGIMNRVQGTWLLDQATRKDALDFFIVLSSISSIMGTKTAAECCAVNQYLDAYPAYAGTAERYVGALNLTLILDDLRDFRGPTPIPPLNFQEFTGCFEQFLDTRPPLAVVSKFDPNEVAYLLPVLKIPFSPGVLSKLGILAEETSSPEQAARSSTAEPSAPSLAAAPSTPPPALANPGDLTHARILEGLRALWLDIIGYESSGTDESFFLAGGTSLTALKLVKAIRERWGVTFEAADVYGHSTLEGMATFIHRKVAPQLDVLQDVVDQVAQGTLSLEDALRSLGGDR